MTFIFAFLSAAGNFFLGAILLAIASIGCGLMWARLWERFLDFAFGYKLKDVGVPVLIGCLLAAAIVASAIWTSGAAGSFLFALGLIVVSLVVLAAVEIYCECSRAPVDAEYT